MEHFIEALSKEKVIIVIIVIPVFLLIMPSCISQFLLECSNKILRSVRAIYDVTCLSYLMAICFMGFYLSSHSVQIPINSICNIRESDLLLFYNSCVLL